MKRKNMKKGITLIEIILAIVLIAIIMGITIPKLMSNSTRAEVKQTVTSDLRSIIEAATTWKRSSSTAAGTYRNINPSRLNSRLPSNMFVDADGYIYSSGLKTGTTSATTSANETGVRYTVMWQFDEATYTDTGRFSIAMDIQKGQVELDWNGKIQTYAFDVFQDTINEASDSDYNAHSSAITARKANEGVATPGTGASFACDNSASMCLGNIRVN